MKDKKVVDEVVRKVMKKFDFDIDDILESPKEEVEQAIKDGILENIEEQPPGVDWIELVELDEAEEHKNGNGDFLSN